MSVIVPFVIILFLVLLNGMFVAAEFAILGVRQTRMAQMAANDNRVAQRLLKIIEDRSKTDRYIAAAQLGITLASLGLGMYGEPAIAHLLEEPLHDWFGLEGNIVHTIGFVVGLGLVTYLHVVIGEMVPKSLALQYAERTVMALARPMALIQTILSIPITILNGIGVWVLKVLGVPVPEEKSRLHTPGELEMIISDGVAGGVINAQDFIMFRSIFDLSELQVHQMMTPRVNVTAVPVTISEQALIDRLGSSPYSRLPVYEGDVDHIVGIIYLEKFAEHQLEGTSYNLRELMEEPVFVPESATAYELLSMFERKLVHIAVVVGEYGGTAGVITLEDILEEVAGEIWDEFDVDLQDPVTVVAPGHLLARGDARLHEVEAFVNLGEHDRAESVAGLVLAHVDLPPRRGDSAELDDIVLRVEEVDGMTVECVSILYPPEKHQPDIPSPSDH